ncbi:trypsin-like peptidase domain-containing protein [Candidatus Roizmanbacteria bacterium]|nr:MAG: trypsin-like peptidase domain-containing protein [Candidatus Roizmanbacteria bacterium]
MEKVKRNISVKGLIIFLSVVILGVSALQHYEPVQETSFFSSLFKNAPSLNNDKKSEQEVKIVSEESIIIDVVDKALPSVVTIGIKVTRQGQSRIQIDPFDPFTPFRETPGEEETIEQNIGSGFIVTEDGIIITNKHVVLETDATYKVVTNDQKEYEVTNIYRDPLNDLAILKIDADNLTPLQLGDSSELKLGQLAIAIGTPLGEFQNTITTGVVSGLGRGITAGSPYEGFVERLDSVIQTDAAISPGNSGGPLLNSSAQVIGVNTAVSSQGQNIGFAIPVNVVKDLLDTFEAQGGSFQRPYIGVRYSMVDEKTAIQNDIVEGAYVDSVVQGSPADVAGIEADDIITRIDGTNIDGSQEDSLARVILRKRVGDSITLTVWRDGETREVSLTVEAYEE